MNNQVGFSDADDCFGITLKGIYEASFPFMGQGRIEGQAISTGDVDEYTTGTFVAGDYVCGSIKMLYTVNVTEAGGCTWNGPFVFFSRCQIFSQSVGDTLPEMKLFNNP